MATSRFRTPTANELVVARRRLGVGADADRDAIRAAWRARQLANHPDTVDPDSRERANGLSAELNAAKDLLCWACDNPDLAAIARRPVPARTRRTGPTIAFEATPSRRRVAKTAPAATAATSAAGPIPAFPWGLKALIVTMISVIVGLVVVVGVFLSQGASSDSDVDARRPVPVAGDLGDEPDLSTPSKALASIVVAATQDLDTFVAAVAPQARIDGVAAIRDEISSNGATFAGAAPVMSDDRCAIQAGLRRANCTLPEIVGRSVEFVFDGDRWQLIGYGV